ncbi:MAG: YbjQ family protein [Actinobacteria bacterium]|nr:YbjQ family protein [Actinomycetota bacterium]
MDFKQAEKTATQFQKGRVPDEEAAPAVQYLYDYWQAHPFPNDKEYRHNARYLVGRAQTYTREHSGQYPAVEAVISGIERVIAEQNAEKNRITEEQQREQHQARVAENRAKLGERLLVTTTPTIEDRIIAEVLGVVSGSCVMSRNAFSDFGSDVSSSFGGRLLGIEKAVRSSQVVALEELEREAHGLGADAVIGIQLSVQTVADKAQLVMLMGTAVLLDDRGSATAP